MAKKPEYWWSRDEDAFLIAAEVSFWRGKPNCDSDGHWTVTCGQHLGEMGARVFRFFFGFAPRKGTCGKVSDLKENI